MTTDGDPDVTITDEQEGEGPPGAKKRKRVKLDYLSTYYMVGGGMCYLMLLSPAAP